MPGTLVIGETGKNGLAGIAGELVAAADRISRREDVSVALIDEDAGAAAAAIAGAGIGIGGVRALQHRALKNGGTGGFEAPVAALAALCRELQPETVLLGKTDFGSNVGPRLAFRLGVPLAQDCIDLTRDAASGRVEVTRPVYGGNALAVYRFGDRDPQIATIRPRIFDPVEPAGGVTCEVAPFDVSGAIGQARARLIETVYEERQGVRLEDAEVVVAGGRGMGGPEPFQKLDELAQLLGGALGASRAACDAGWIDHSRQIGLTGKSISPRAYITVGISGASQHMAGCSGAKNIIAINKDADANIFKEARFGVVGEWQKVLPAFISAVRGLNAA